MGNNVPFVSVIMITYNSASFVAVAVSSVLAQTYKHFELLICDDCSSDGTWEIIESFHSEHIRKIRNENNIGEYQNRNKCITLAKGDYIIFIDGDDIIYPYGLQFMIDFAMQFPGCDMIISRPWDERIIYPKVISPHQFYCFEFLDGGIAGINFTKILFKSRALQSATPFPSRVKMGDLFMQYEIALRSNSLIIPDACTWWRRTRGQASEKLLNNYAFYLEHELWMKLEKLTDTHCPLTHEEKNIAYANLYGNYMRYLLRQMLRARLKIVFHLLSIYPVPYNFWNSLIRKPQRNYFGYFDGTNPMCEKPKL